VHPSGNSAVTRSANCDFFAAEADLRALLDFLYQQTDVRVFESYSVPEAELQEFTSVEALCEAFRIGLDEHGNGHAALLQLWSPSVMKQPRIERFALDPEACAGRTFRHRIAGAGLIQLHLGGVCGKVVTMSHLGHQSLARAQAWGIDDGVDWEALKKLSGRIAYHLRHRLAAGKVPGRPVLSQALGLAQSGYELKLATQTPWRFELVG